MKPACLFIRRARCSAYQGWFQKRSLLTLAIETSCDDTSVAILERTPVRTRLHFHEKVTSDNRAYYGVHPLVALESHQKSLAKLVRTSLQSLPEQPSADAQLEKALVVSEHDFYRVRRKPDFVTVTRGPGMRSSLATGLDTAKGLSVAWQVPLLGVNHMQAHALTPRLVAALKSAEDSPSVKPEFPYLTFLVSGGHTMLVQSKSLCDHKILATTTDMAIGDAIDKCARDILPTDILESGSNVMYGRLLESFAFPSGPEGYAYIAPASKGEEIEVKKTGYSWSFTPPLSQSSSGAKTNALEFCFSGIGSTVKRAMKENPDMQTEERRVLARETMRIAFEHLVSRLLIALKDAELKKIQTVVVSGGVASNQYLKHILRAMLDRRGFTDMHVNFPPPSLCTDNAAMIAWTGMEMWEAGHRTDLEALTLRKWAIDPEAEDGGILGVDGWMTVVG